MRHSPDTNEPAWGSALRRLAGFALVVSAVVSIWLYGFPLDAAQIYMWVGAALLVGSLGRSRAWVKSAALTWIPFVALIAVYQVGYGAAGRFTTSGDLPMQGDHNVLGIGLHVDWPVKADRFLFGELPTTWVQSHFHTVPPPWFAWIVTCIYCSHFVLTPVAAVILWWRGSPLFKPWIRMILALAGIGLSIYFLFPMAPPWLAGQEGYIATPVLRTIGEGWSQLHLGIAAAALNDADAVSNPVAAMPSLHMATATLAAIVLPWRCRKWVRVLALVYPAGMAFTLLYGGEHYAIDEIVGAAITLAIVAGWRVLARRSTRHLANREALSRTPDRAMDVV